jgi:TRAP transporter 4TM/12TM fusion protein
MGLFLFYMREIEEAIDDSGETVADPAGKGGKRVLTDETDVVSSRLQRWFDGSSAIWRRNVRPVITRANPVVCLLLAIVAVGATAYVEHNFDRLLSDAPIMGWSQTDLLIGVVIILLAVDATYRAYGKAIAAVVAGSLLYATTMIGPLLPGVFGHSGLGWEQISRNGAIGLSGVYGFILTVGSTWVAIFIMFAGIAKVYGLMDFIIDASQETQKSLKSGVVHIAVVGSMVMGSITGSAAANTATTGSFTIPMMKDQGIRKDFAAAIESVASTGGQMLPPVMGVAAFLMADMLGISYVRVIQAGILPAALFYFSVFIAVHLVLLKYGWTVPNTGKFDKSVLLSGIHFLVPLTVLAYTLAVMRLTPLGAGLYSTIALIGTVYVRNFITDGLSLSVAAETTKQTIHGFRQGGVDVAPLVGVLASLGIVLSMVTQTGLTQKISAQMVGLAGGIFVFLLLIAAITSIMFGLGMPTPAAYILVVILVAPAMVGFGVREITAHMFVFYFAMLSAITPPVAIAVAIGSKIADASFLTSSKQALRIGAPGFVIPFAFVTNDSLLYWSFPETIVAACLVFVSIASLTVATTGFNGQRTISLPHRGLYLALSGVGMWGPLVIQGAAVVGIICLLAFENKRVEIARLGSKLGN